MERSAGLVLRFSVGASLRRLRGLVLGALSFAFLIFVLNPIQMASVLLRPLSLPAFRAVNRWCARTIWGLWVVMGERMNGIDVRVTGDRIPAQENGLVLANHQGMADVLALLCFAFRGGRLGDLKFFVKEPLKYVPGPGWGMQFLDCVFVKRDWAQDRDEIHRLFEKYKREQIPLYLVSFLEGTRRTPKKLLKSQEFARSRGLPIPEHTLVPRTRGFVATMNGLREHLDAVYDLTIAYPAFTPTLVDCFGARVAQLQLHVRRYSIDALPKDDDALTAWVLARFQEKDALLAGREKEGTFPGEPWSERARLGDLFRAERCVAARFAGKATE